MPLIPPYGLRVPEKSDQPDVAGDMLNLGEDVRDELLRIDNDIAGLVTDIEEAALGWVPIGAGEQSNVSAFVIDVTAGASIRRARSSCCACISAARWTAPASGSH